MKNITIESEIINNKLIKINRKILIKSNDQGKFGIDPYERSINELINFGIIIVDKPEGPTSHQVSSYVRDILHIKTGHSGTLDPKVSGVLPIGTGKATRVLHYLLLAGKEYIGTMQLHSDVQIEKIEKTKKQFIGEIKQLPPVRSAVKRRIRKRKIYYFEILEIKKRNILFRIGVEAGTYIRKLCHDFGLALGTRAQMTHLRRTKVGLLEETKAHHIYDIKDSLYFYNNQNYENYIRKVILPAEIAVTHLPKIWVKDATVYYLTHGGKLFIPGIAKLTDDVNPKQPVAIFTLKNELIGVGKTSLDALEIFNKTHGIAVRLDNVYMDQNHFPRLTKEE